MAGEALAAIDRAALAGLEGHLCLPAALVADYRIHGPGGASILGVVPAPQGTARGASSRFVEQATALEELLLTSGEHKRVAAVFAHQRLVCEGHHVTSLLIAPEVAVALNACYPCDIKYRASTTPYSMQPDKRRGEYSKRYRGRQ